MAVHSPITVARFWSKVAVTRSTNDCWPWTASTTDGYGKMKVGGAMHKANRLSWEIFNNELLGERFACHHCDNRTCCNPFHIYAGSHLENMQDAADRGRFVIRDQSGTNNGNCRLTDADVDEILRRIGEGETNIAIARDFPVTHSMVSRIRRGRSWAMKIVE